jgi:hypothetical protein
MEATGETTTEPSTTELLRDLLKRAETAHGLHEKALGQRDPDWPQWYAEYMASTLREAGYRITRSPSP